MATSNKLYIFDCLSGKLRVSDRPFMSVGQADKNVFRCKMSAETAGSFAVRGGSCTFFPHSALSSYSLNGVRYTSESIINPNELNLMVIAGGCLICWIGDETAMPDFSTFNTHEWFIYRRAQSQWQGPMALSDITRLRDEAGERDLAAFDGLTSCAFLLTDIIDVAEYALGNITRAPSNQRIAVPPSAANATRNNLLRCPHCWQEFPLAHTLAIAEHPSLRGDQILGPTAAQRFTPQQTDAHGYPMDAMGVSVHEYACPWCHQKLPPFFLYNEQHIISLIGLPASGKSYYLATMLHELEYTLSREFDIAFRDADPFFNEPLNSLRSRIFTATCAKDAYLPKTELQSKFYHEVWRSGRFSLLPKPFIYNLSQGQKNFSLALYDTASQGFESTSTRDQSADPSTAASAIFFLFDPAADPSFCKLINKDHIPASIRPHALHERQALLLSAAEMRIRRALRLMPEQKLDIPLAIIIGKSDIWQHLLGPEPLLPSVRSGQFQTKFTDANSKRLRQLMFDISPHICAMAEAISSNVRYFAASAFGSEPEIITDDHSGEAAMAPAGGKPHPTRVIDPMLWALSCIYPGLLNKSRA